MSRGVLKYTLVVRHPDTGVATPIVAGSEVPEWAEDLVHDDDLETTPGPSTSTSDTGADGADGEAKKAPAKRPASRKTAGTSSPGPSTSTSDE